MTISEQILFLAESLLPKGRAFRFKGVLKRLFTATSISQVQLYDDTVAILDSVLPDNDNFSTQDCLEWETRLGLITNTSVSLADRKAAILRKMNYPGDIPARQGAEYLQGELQKAGFDVYVFENAWYEGGQWVTQDPGVVSGGVGFGGFQHGQYQHGQFVHGGYFSNIVANSIYAEDDINFQVGGSLRATFFIGGNRPAYGDVGLFANVDADRELEFRQLILKIKPTQTIAYLLVNYI